MRFALLNTDYAEFLSALYSESPGLANESYEQQMAARNASLFGVADFYSRHLRALGHVAIDLHINNQALQLAWAREHGLRLPRESRTWRLTRRKRVLPWLDRVSSSRWTSTLLGAQIEEFQPDVILNHDMGFLRPSEVHRLLPSGALLVGQHAMPPLPDWDYEPYDVVLSSWPPTIKRFRSAGIQAEPFRLGFEARLAREIASPKRDIEVLFIGSLSPVHPTRIAFLEQVCAEITGVQVFGPAVRRLARYSPIRACYRGPAWGRSMYALLARARIALNHHGVDAPYANNLRLYEATGMGAALLTDAKPDLHRLFRPGVEVLTFSDDGDCVRTLRQLEPGRISSTAAAGQRRTLADHTWELRMAELVAIIDRYR